MTPPVPQIAKVTPDDSNIVITIPKEKIGEFIGDVLKTKRRIGKRFGPIFNIRKMDVIDIIDVIEHRINEQNNADLIDLSINILFEDGSSREYVSKDQFIQIDDNLKSISVALFINLSYLIKFNENENPTKNEIRITANTFDVGEFSLFMANLSKISIMVETNKFTWAEDIINNFSNYIEGKYAKRSFLQKNYNKVVFNPLYFLIYITIFFSGLISTVFYLLKNASNDDYKIWNTRAKSVSGDGIDLISKKVDFLISYITSSHFPLSNQEFTLRIGLFIISYVICLFLGPVVYFSLSGKCYISIGRVSEDKNEQKIQRRKYLKYTVVIGALISILCSVLSSYIYSSLTSK